MEKQELRSAYTYATKVNNYSGPSVQTFEGRMLNPPNCSLSYQSLNHEAPKKVLKTVGRP